MVAQTSRRSFLGGMAATATAAASLPVAAIARDADGGSEGLAYRAAGDLVKAIAGRQVSSRELVDSAISRIEALDPQIALAQVRTMDQVKEESLGEDRYTMVLFACFAAVALLLAAVGIYGLMAYAVSQRVQEIGVRIALGATRLQVFWLILEEASLLAAIGLGIGLVGSVLVGRTMRTTLYGVAALDFSVIVSVGVILFLAALIASYLPARRAALIDPMQALRTD